MLAADAGVAVESAATGSNAHATSAVESITTATESGGAVVFIDGAVKELAAVAEPVAAGAELVLLHGDADGVAQIRDYLDSHPGVQQVHIVSHGSAGRLQLGSTELSTNNLKTYASDLRAWGNQLSGTADILFYGCDVAGSASGKDFLREIAHLTGADVAASDDRTGNVTYDADWDLEYTTGSIESSIALSQQAMNAFQGHLAIEIRAAGSMGNEEMQLQIGDTIVSTFTVTNTGVFNGNYQSYFANIDGANINDIRINFVNDVYDPDAGIDSNIGVDWIRVDGVQYETESPNVFSTGTWKPEDGITPGFRKSPYLHTTGYFQYAGTNGGNGSVIEVSLWGDEGGEDASLLINGSVVRTYSNLSTTPQTFSYQSEGSVTADQVRVRFNNDVYDPGAGIDRNLNVDFIRIDGQTFQTEDPSTYSTGTWLPADGIQPGNRLSQTLHSNGYFQYSTNTGNPGNNPGQFSIQPSQITVNEGSGQVTINVKRLGGSDGAVSVGYYTVDDTAVAGSDYVAKSGRLNFADGQDTLSVTIDLIDDSSPEGTESFAIVLDQPIGTNILIPRTSTIVLVDNDSFVPSSPTFTANSGLNLNGNATIGNGNLNLTNDYASQAGSAFYETPIAISNNTSFQANFQFWIGGRFGTTGGEGLTFTLQNSPQGSNAVGNYWYGLGYEGITKSIAIEIDTYTNGFESGGPRQVAVVADGVVRSQLASADLPYMLNDSREYYVWVDYNGDSDKLAVFVSDTPTKPAYASLVTTIDLQQKLGNQAYVGFTAGSYIHSAQQLIRNFDMSFAPPAFDPPVRPPLPNGTLQTETVISGLNQPLAIKWSSDGSNLYVAEKVGVLKVSRNGGSVQTVIDISNQVNDFNDRGLIDFAIHPDLQNNPYAYLLYTYDPPEVYNNTGVAGPDGNGNRAGRLMRVTLDAATNYTTVVAGSETILLGTNSVWSNFNGYVDSTNNYSQPAAGRNPDGSYIRDFINSDSQSHTVGSLEFGIDGNLFVSIGDGSAYTAVDPRALKSQDVNSLNGKVLRINPITGQGISSNPFFTGNANDNASKVFQLGLRNPWRMTVDPQSGQLYIGDTGWISYEEINTGNIGANFGWPYYEGRQGTNSPTPSYSGLSGAAAFYANNNAVAPVVAVSHSGTGDAVALGGYINGSTLGAAFDDSFFYVNVYEGTVRYFRTDAQGNLTDNQVFTRGTQFVTDIQQGADGSVYFVSLLAGTVGRWQFV